MDLISADIAKKYLVMPVNRNKSYLSLAMVDPTDLEAINNIKFRTGLNLHPLVASEISIMNAIRKYYGSSDTQAF